jgi:hypothetical protein
MWRRRPPDASIDDVVQILYDVARTLMRVDARIESIYLLVGREDEEADA